LFYGPISAFHRPAHTQRKMDNVLNITGRLEHKKRKEQIEAYREKFDTIQRVLHCSSCHFKCAMCGYHIEPPDAEGPPSSAGAEFNLCERCAAEYEDFKRMKQGRADDSHPFWHNAEWMAFWTAWCEYQRSILRFRNSLDLKNLEGPPED
jgi:hypothetical protein